ncbi:carboxypeptidase-like regulatory domain-containing protein [Oceanithermus sp.]
MSTNKPYLLALLAAALLALAGCAGETGAATRTVSGLLLDPYGQPVAYTTVAIAGAAPVLTDPEGRFEIDGVPAGPYDLLISGVRPGFGEAMAAGNVYAASAGYSLLVYVGLTQDELSLTVFPAGAGDAPHSAQVDGLLNPQRSAADEDVEATKNGVWVVAEPYCNSYKFASNPDGDERYGVRLGYGPDAEVEARLGAARWTEDELGNAASFLGFYSGSVGLNGGELAKDIQLQELEPADRARAVNVSLNLPEGYELYGARHYLTTSPLGGGVMTGYLDSEDLEEASPMTFSFVRPGAAGVYSNVSVDAGYELGGAWGDVYLWWVGDDTDAELAVPAPLIPLAPLDGSEIDAGTRFSWSGPDGALYVAGVMLGTYNAGLISIAVVTTEKSFTVPDLASLGINFDDFAIGDGAWAVAALGGQGVPAEMAELDAGNTRRMFFAENGLLQVSGQGFSEAVFGGEFASGR